MFLTQSVLPEKINYFTEKSHSVTHGQKRGHTGVKIDEGSGPIFLPGVIYPPIESKVEKNSLSYRFP